MLIRSFVLVIVVMALVLTAGALYADDMAPTVPAESVAPAVPAVAAAVTSPSSKSVCVPDTEIFRRTPVIDGKIEDGEWDVFYSYDAGGWKATTYVDWDSANIYMGVKSSQPVELMIVLDANDDGWFHGDENYEFKAAQGADGNVALAVGRYESRNTKAPVATPVTDGEAGMVELKSSNDGEWYCAELRMPAALIRGFRLRDKQNVGFNMMVRPAGTNGVWEPTNQVGDVRECSLVSKKFATLKPLEVGFDLKDMIVARGETMSGKLYLTNAGTEQLDVRSFVIGGEGRAGQFLSSERIRMEGLDPKQHISHPTSTLVPSDMPVGCWAIGTEILSNSSKLGAGLVSFEVVDPFDLELRIPGGDVRSDVKNVSLAVNVKNNMRRSISGTAKITLPVGWELWRNLDTRDFTVRGEGNVTGVLFKAKPPLGELGDVDVKFEVTVGKDTKTIEGKFQVVNP